MKKPMRINKFIAKSGYTSRRKADDLIAAGKVRVNGEVMTQMGYDVADDDVVEIDGEILTLNKFFYYKLNKPVGYITSNFDPHNDLDLNNLIDIEQRFFAAGRLDKDSRGLLIITNDGDFTNKLTHPSNGITKEYIVKVDKALSYDKMQAFEGELDIGNDEISRKAIIREISYATYLVKIWQGYNRQIRRMFDVLGSSVIDLQRIKIGAIELGEIAEGEYEAFDKNDMDFVSLIKG